MFQLFSEDGLPPHGFCLLWQPDLIWLHAVSDTLIGVAYYLIPVALAWLVIRRRDIAVGWMFWLFASFILACGTTHFMEVWVLWHPDYALQGMMKAFTAAVSLLTASLLWPLVPRLLAIPTPAQFRRVSDMLTDETVRHEQTAEQLRQTEESFRRLVEGVTDYGFCLLDPTGCVSTWNAGAARITGYASQDIIGRHFSCFYTAEERDAGVPARALAIAAEEGRYEAEGWRIRQDGKQFWAHLILEPILDDSGKLFGFAKITRDITERREAEEALERTRATLAQAQKMEAVGHLTGGIAHDFNNLLTAILGSLEMLERPSGVESARARRLMRVIRHAAERGAELTSRLLAFSRKQALAPEAVDVNRLVAGLSELLRRTLGEGVAIDTVLAGNTWPVFIDRNQLENALLNLAVNARDAMPDGGKLTIETGNTYLDAHYAVQDELAPGPYVVVAVSDTGRGMPPDVMAHAFEPFYTTKPVGQGTGLGLSQVYGFVKQSGGHVKLCSDPGLGTTITLYLPRLVGETVEVTPPPTAAEPDLPRGSETLLVVEDDDGVRDYSANAARELGYTVLEAPDGARALQLLEERQDIRLLFTDVGLPGMNGRQLADEAMRRLPGLKVVFTTGYARDAIMHHGLLDRGVHLLAKPFTFDGLARILRRVLDGG